jgi:hypothetical protein
MEQPYRTPAPPPSKARPSFVKRVMKDMSKWWTWEWDRMKCPGGKVTYNHITRWRRGWVTLYKLVTHYENKDNVVWRLFLPFNLNVGIEYDTGRR